MLGGTPDELRLVALGLQCLAERLEVAERPSPPLLCGLRRHLSDALGRLEPSTGAGLAGSGEGGVMGPLPLLLTYHEAAIQTRLSVSTIERAVRDGRLRAVKEGRSVRIKPVDLEEFVAAMATRKGA